jgi:hypothetical protein
LSGSRAASEQPIGNLSASLRQCYVVSMFPSIRQQLVLFVINEGEQELSDNIVRF